MGDGLLMLPCMKSGVCSHYDSSSTRIVLEIATIKDPFSLNSLQKPTVK